MAIYTTISCTKNGSATSVISAINNQRSVSLYNCNETESASGVQICYDSLLGESRCPENANCILAGYAMIKVSFHENGNTHRFKMIITPSKGTLIGNGLAVNDTTINGYRITLTDLLPYPKMSTPAPTPDQQKAIFKIVH